MLKNPTVPDSDLSLVMNGQPKKNVCITLPYPPVYSETFLKSHVEKLAAAVNYLEDFPIDVDDEFPKQVLDDKTEQLKRRLRAAWHRYVMNPKKTIYLRTFFKTNNINLVLAEYGLTGLAVLEACKKLKIPLAVHFHGFDAYSNVLLDRHKENYKNMFAYASAIIAVSKHMTEQLIKLGAPREKVFYNAYGVDTTKFRNGCRLTSPMQVIAVGRFVEKKAPYLTILAFKKVLKRLPEVKLVMVGAGELHDACRQLIKSLHMEHAVDLKGAINHDQVVSLMQQSRVFVQHSLVPQSGDTEGSPVAIIEAGASGLPVVSTRHAGIVDAVIDGQTGFLVNEGDIDGMAEYIYLLLSNAAPAAEMGQRAREYITQKFSLEARIKSLRDILEKCSL